MARRASSSRARRASSRSGAGRAAFLGALGALGAVSAQAQDAAKPATVLQPTLTIRQTLTNNRDLASSNPQGDLVTEVSPGVHLSSRSGRVQGTLDYSLDGFSYARESSRNAVQHSLSGVGRAELIENHAYVDVHASVAQQALSAYGTQSAGTGLIGNNQTQVSSLSITPSLRGKVRDWFDVLASVNWATSRSQSTTNGDSNAASANLDLGHRAGKLGWGLNLNHQKTDFIAGSSSYVDQAVARIDYYPRYDTKLTLRGGEQSTNIETGARQGSATWGATATWQPTDHTDVLLTADHQYFGNSHTFSLTHRMPQSIWSYTDTSGVSTPTAAGMGTGGQVPLFQALLALNGGDPFAALRALQNLPANLSANPIGLVPLGFLQSSLTLQRTQTLGVTFNGLRDSITVNALRSQNQQLPGLLAAASGGDIGLYGAVRQFGLTLGLAHRLTPTSSLNLSASTLATLDAPSQPGSRQRNYSITWSGELGPHLGATLGARRIVFTSLAAPYNETAVVGTLGMKF
ncbi:MAG: TIGR03016 family PEP-CTERM system-associated outer membrane protein [Burkholderiales bacterium]|nr:TIGR03016 family PEP-CTERM system-associated outer membrane protein [Burkholderiales bacterium]MDE2397909.1 TIGR03016 family PEP-CTERM system-associated outer membrane protein [Burkholderiales bacterium]MDE2457008.1 TIGR03016 family PEP-CTERM system-associated outer membrane protein [Burkholderiales bacterium]